MPCVGQAGERAWRACLVVDAESEPLFDPPAAVAQAIAGPRIALISRVDRRLFVFMGAVSQARRNG
ncbi:hypothetical protein CAI18_22850 [Xanthomonas citri pv. punicae]|uniref:Uncharacterized protein n=1 Tax=Xanthomonas campestris pv. malvacearum TaxID=86040 RepID=A0AA45BVB2_XANCM|nr:hypothetical protein APY29_22265 [Xanthomonas citri pv. malvacearum]EKQ60428.1 hypothetical protein WS7_13297 [Xanthomonas citri pv. malvacearum str. GSPB2388]EKQ65601.1 hypothetical protein MOU_04644 [Xanthomonas citri pv. malvacearum str. GSPB1386]NMI13916.1 hypothetical protein [Xanthomonas citri]OOW63035.1 hypothetical protein Xths_13475 [Xanthomonas campestris pv. thespesiae]OOW82557.1 hypothetical protein Xlen_06850 [Xanthomonas campestris pv. leeana]QCZ67250.1 hypothetical protein C